MTITDRQLELLAAIDRGIQVNGYAPSTTELKEAMGVESTSIVLKQIDSLERQGYLDKEIATWRGLRVTELGSQVITAGVDSLSYRVLRAVQQLVERMGHGPSQREICEHTGLHHVQVRKCIGRLEVAVMVSRPLPTWRSMSVTPRGKEALLERVADRDPETA